jgi:4-hydroxy-tetrahydrodipicolinate synthase
MSLRNQLKGVGVALVTPFQKNTEVDYDALSGVIDFVIEGGVDYLVTLGTTAETPTLSSEEKKAIINFTCEKVNNKIPVVVGMGSNNTRELIEDLQTYPLEKAVAVLSAGPYYSRPSQEGLYQHYKAIAKASPRPVILYNVPSRTGRNINASTVIRLSKEEENIIGIKEAGGDFAQCMQILRDAPGEFLVVSGDDALAFPQIACGMQGVISVAANAFPQAFCSMIDACLDDDFALAKTFNDSLIDAYEIMFSENNPAGVKAFMAEMGLLKNVTRLPVTTLSDEGIERVKKYLKK